MLEPQTENNILNELFTNWNTIPNKFYMPIALRSFATSYLLPDPLKRPLVFPFKNWFQWIVFFFS